MVRYRPILKKNDRIVFLGDSITEQQLYTNYVETYLSLRYPELNLTFFNAGWGGDTAPGGVRRLLRDVLSLKPSVVTICYGMNDGRYVPSSDQIIEDFTSGMKELVRVLKKARIRVVLLTPGMVDDSKAPHLKDCEYNTKGLRLLADVVVGIAKREKIPYSDIHRLMNSVDRKAKVADPSFCMIPDAVHPDPAGQLVMAFGLLQALGIPPSRQVLKSKMSRSAARSNSPWSVDLVLDHPPFFVEPQARKVLPYLPFQDTYNSATWSMTGLAHESYVIRSGAHRSIGMTAENLVRGIAIQEQWYMEPMRMSAAIHRCIQEKNRWYFTMWRMVSLNGTGGEEYYPKVHRSAVAVVPKMDRERMNLLRASTGKTHLTLTPRNKLSEALNNGEFILQWNLLGPFPKPFESDRIGGEASFTASPPRLGPEWTLHLMDPIKLGDCLNSAYGPSEHCWAYAVAHLHSEAEQDAMMLLGSDDGFAAWLNGSLLLNRLELARGCSADSDKIPLHLRAGSNVLLLKITQLVGSWGFCVRFEGLKQSLSLVLTT